MRRSTAAFSIALLLHILLIILFLFLENIAPEKKIAQKKEQQRIKVSLRQNLKAAEESLVENRVKKSKIAPPMPKGKQLKKLVEKPFVKPPKKPIRTKPINKPKPKPKKPTPKKIAPIPSEKPYIPVKNVKPKPKNPVEKPKKIAEANITKEIEKPKKHNKLYNFLSQEKKPIIAKEKKRENRKSDYIKDAYGDTFGELSEGEQKYILDNQEIMRRITQEVLNRVGGVNLPNNLRVNESNIVEFYLYPNGDISDIKFIGRSGFYILDDTTKETIEYAYSRYPRPKQKTLIRYRVGYYLRGY